jgi:hypothetical protein
VWCLPATITSNALSYSFSQTSHVAIQMSFARRGRPGGVRFVSSKIDRLSKLSPGSTSRSRASHFVA